MWHSKELGVGFQQVQEVIGGWGTHLGVYCVLSSSGVALKRAADGVLQQWVGGIEGIMGTKIH